jgi:L-malate glycosyltransferase
MRILVIPSWYPPQGGEFFKEQNDVLHSLGVSVQVFYCEYIDSKDFFKKKNTPSDNGLYKVHREQYQKVPGFYRFNQERYATRFKKTLEKFLEKQSRPDIVYAHSALFAGYAAADWCKKNNVPLVIQEHRSRFSNHPLSTQLLPHWQLPYAKKAYYNASAFFSISSSIKTRIQTLFPKMKAKVHDIPNMTDTNFFSLKPERKSDICHFLAIGRLEYYKGMDVLINAFLSWCNKYSDAHLTIIGEGKQLPKLRKQCALNRLEEKVTFKGHQSKDEILKALHDCDALILPSRFEAFGVVAIEALSSGTPVIATRSGGPEDIVNKQNGILCEANSSEAIYQALTEFYETRNRFNKEQIRQDAIDKYNKLALSNKIITIFNTYQ